ncbi:unnamed protein product [Calypogeia fissa]
MILGCEGLADYHCGLHSLEVPVSNGTGLHQSTCSFAAHFGSKCGRWKAEDWCESGALSSDRTGIFSDNALLNSADNKEEEIGDSSGLSPDDSEGIALYIDLPCSPCQDSAEIAYFNPPEQFVLAEGPKGGTVGPALQTGSHEQLRVTSRAEVSQRFDSRIASNLSSRVLRAWLENDNGPGFKRWRQVTAIDQNPECASYMFKKPERFTNLKMSTSPVKEGLVESGPRRDVKAGLPESDFMMGSGGDQQGNCCQGESPCLIVEKIEAKIPWNLGTHALRALMEADDVQKLKRRRLTTPADSTAVKDSKDFLDGISPDFVSRQSSDLPSAKETECSEESLPSPDSNGVLVRRTSAESDIAQSTMDNAGSGDSVSEIASSGLVTGKSDKSSDSSESPSHSHDRETLDKYITRPPRYSSGASIEVFSPKKKEWLGQRHGGNKGETGSSSDKSFAGNVGMFYRSAIDKRPAAPHPGFVGDGANIQFCRVCGEREDATSSLICDSCEQVFHMGCINVRMKIIPRVDEWLCRPCKRKRKMCRESENQGDSDNGGEPKDWWREDSRIGRVERELLRMSNGKRMKVRLGPKYQADVPDWTGIVDEVDLDDNLAETSYRFGDETALTSEEKRLEQDTAEYNLAENIWPRGWLPATHLPPGSREKWIQCTLVLFDEGDICPDGSTAQKDIVCGKWRRAPLGIVPDDQWECSCALVWDPRHADCAVPQELSTEEIDLRMKSSKLHDQEAPAYV